ncbi:hypothetical protein JCM10207_006454 [Rhodosporidiobolus poonsookiae]
MAEVSPSSTPSSSLFDKLPIELLKLIVSLVREQDERLEDEEIDCGRLQYRDCSDDEDDCFDDGADAARGCWSMWYRSGIEALSLCNKALRQLAVPYLFQRATTTSLGLPFSRMSILGGPLCQYIRHLDIANSGTDDEFAAAAALRFLPSLREVSFCGTRLPPYVLRPNEDYDRTWRNESSYAERPSKKDTAVKSNMTRTAFRNLSSTIERVNLTSASINSVVSVLTNFAAPNSLRHLHMSGNASFFCHPNELLQQAFQPFALTSLRMDDLAISEYSSGLDYDETWNEALRMPSLETLAIRTPSNPGKALLFIQACAPNVVELRLTHMGTLERLPSQPVPTVALPRLKRLETAGHPSCSAFLPVFASTPLSGADFSLTACHTSRLNFPSMFPATLSFPPSLQRIRVSCTGQHRPGSVDSVAAHLEHRGVSLSISWTPDTDLDLACYASDTASISNSDVDDDDVRSAYNDAQRKAAIKSTLDWASRRVDWLYETKDQGGIDELASNLRWVRERQMIESL